MCVSLDTLHAGLLRQAYMRKNRRRTPEGVVDGLQPPEGGPESTKPGLLFHLLADEARRRFGDLELGGAHYGVGVA